MYAVASTLCKIYVVEGVFNSWKILPRSLLVDLILYVELMFH